MKKLCSTFLALLTATLFSGCGNSSTPSNSAPNSTNVTPVPSTTTQNQKADAQITELEKKVADLDKRIEAASKILHVDFLVERRFDTTGGLGVYECTAFKPGVDARTCALIAPESDVIDFVGSSKRLKLAVSLHGERETAITHTNALRTWTSKEFVPYYQTVPDTDVAKLRAERAAADNQLKDLLDPNRVTLRQRWAEIQKRQSTFVAEIRSKSAASFQTDRCSSAKQIREMIDKMEAFDRSQSETATASIAACRKAKDELDAFRDAAQKYLDLFPELNSSDYAIDSQIGALAKLAEIDRTEVFKYHRALLGKLPATADSVASLVGLIKTVEGARSKDATEWNFAPLVDAYDAWMKAELASCHATSDDIAALPTDDRDYLGAYIQRTKFDQARTSEVQRALLQRQIDAQLSTLAKIREQIVSAAQKTNELNEAALADSRSKRQQAFDNAMSNFISGYADVVRATGRRDLNLDVNVRSMNNLNGQLKQWYESNQDACLRSLQKNEVVTQLTQFMAEFKTGIDRLKSLGGEPVGLPAAEFDKIKAMRDSLPNLPQKFLTQETVRDAMRGNKTKAETEGVPAAKSPESSTPGTSELDRVMKLTGVTELKGARVSVLMKRLNDLAQSNIHFEVGEELGKERVTIDTDGKTVEAILAEATRQVGGSVETSATAVRIVRGGRRDDGKKSDTVRKIKDVLGQ